MRPKSLPLKALTKPLAPLVLEAEIRQPQRDCAVCRWDREHACLRVEGVYHAGEALPADLAVVLIEQQLELPLLVLTPVSLQPGVRAQVQILGAIRPQCPNQAEETLPLAGWLLIAVADLGSSTFPWQTLEQVPAPLWTALITYAQMQAEDSGTLADKQEIALCNAEMVGRLLRETRLVLKRQRRTQQRTTGWHPDTSAEPSGSLVVWRAATGLSMADREAVQQGRPGDTTLPHAQAEQLLRFVPVRFQEALATLLLTDERILAFVERQALYQSSQLFGRQQWHAHAGLLLVTDRQVLWLRDMFAPGNSEIQNGYIAHTLPLERLLHTWVLPPETLPTELIGRLMQSKTRYHRLVVELDSRNSSELVAIEFPKEAEPALVAVVNLLHPFLSSSMKASERKLRRLPVVEAWLPSGAEAERLKGLGGVVRQGVAHGLEQQCAAFLAPAGEELLVSALVPALEAHHSPARLVALTRAALLVIEEEHNQHKRRQERPLSFQRYEIRAISSVRLRYSLMGSGLSLTLPQEHRQVKHLTLPFHSPAVAWFLPLYIRLRLLLSLPYS